MNSSGSFISNWVFKIFALLDDARCVIGIDIVESTDGFKLLWGPREYFLYIRMLVR